MLSVLGSAFSWIGSYVSSGSPSTTSDSDKRGASSILSSYENQVSTSVWASDDVSLQVLNCICKDTHVKGHPHWNSLNGTLPIDCPFEQTRRLRCQGVLCVTSVEHQDSSRKR